MTPPQIKQRVAERILSGDDKCKTCGRLIPVERLKTIPDTATCVEHSEEGRYIGVPLYTHKTAATVAMVKADPTADDGLGESVRQLINGYRRKR